MCYVMLLIGVFERGNDRIEWMKWVELMRDRMKKDCELQFKRESMIEWRKASRINHLKSMFNPLPSLKQQIILSFLLPSNWIIQFVRNKHTTHTKVHLLVPSIRADSRKKIRDVSGKPAISHLLPSLLRWTRPPKTAIRWREQTKPRSADRA